MSGLPSDPRDPFDLVTHFAPAERASPGVVQEVAAAVRASPVMGAALRSLGGILMVLNPQRQIIAVNDDLLRLLGCEEPEKLLGMRPGEALHCVHAKDNPGGGCGTGPFCRTCGAAVTNNKAGIFSAGPTAMQW